jgi:hypothetical protein
MYKKFVQSLTPKTFFWPKSFEDKTLYLLHIKVSDVRLNESWIPTYPLMAFATERTATSQLLFVSKLLPLLFARNSRNYKPIDSCWRNTSIASKLLWHWNSDVWLVRRNFCEKFTKNDLWRHEIQNASPQIINTTKQYRYSPAQYTCRMMQCIACMPIESCPIQEMHLHT